jgi:anthranilate synthase component 1
MMQKLLDLDARVLLELAANSPPDFPFFLDSASNGPLGQWSILAAYPEASIRRMGDGRLLSENVVATGGFLSALDTLWTLERTARQYSPPAPPFRGGWVVFLGYEVASEIEPNIRFPAAAAGQTIALAQRCRAALCFDHWNHKCWAIAEDGCDALLARLSSQAEVAGLRRSALPYSNGGSHDCTAPTLIEDDPLQFKSAVEAALVHIAAGDVYQANLSREWQQAPTDSRLDFDRYRSLRAANPGPFAAWVQLDEMRIMSSSPERLVRTVGSKIETRPIAGTRPRLAPESSASEIHGMLANPKERAEHIMLIDLERNDLGRVCQPGTVRVDEFMVTESYAHVHHIVSNVCGELRPEVTPVQVLRALFPGGTITGCPKYRCMEIIAALEAAPRGAYTGSVGYINLDGDMDFNILIRTLTLDQSGLRFRAGAGIVADSIWERELEETRAKARGLIRAMSHT